MHCNAETVCAQTIADAGDYSPAMFGFAAFVSEMPAGGRCLALPLVAAEMPAAEPAPHAELLALVLEMFGGHHVIDRDALFDVYRQLHGRKAKTCAALDAMVQPLVDAGIIRKRTLRKLTRPYGNPMPPYYVTTKYELLRK